MPASSLPQSQLIPFPEADSPGEVSGTLQLGEWTFEPELDRIARGGKIVKLEPQLARLLHFLAQGAGRVLTKDEIIDGVWGTRFVADSALTRAMAELRRALGDDAHHPRFIGTIPKRGYRLVVTVEAVAGGGAHRTGRPPSGHRYAALVVLGLCALLVTGGYATSRRPPQEVTIAAPDLRLAVLPLDNLNRDPEQDYFADGMTEALITRLARIDSLSVISRRSVEPFRGERRSLSEIADTLGVDVVVEGSVLRADGRVRISVQLTNLDDDAHLWAQSYEREARDVLALQSEVALAIAREIRATLRVDRAPALLVDPRIYELYLRGRQQLMQCKQGPNQAAEYFRAALELDPDYAPAYAGLADYYSRLAFFGHLPAEEALPPARAAARKALELDASLAEAHAASAFVRFALELDWAGAESGFLTAVDLDPSPWVGMRYSIFLTCLGRFEEALIQARRAVELDPLSSTPRKNLAWVLLNARRYDESLAEMSKMVDLGMADAPPPFISWVYSLMGRHQEALAEIAEIADPDHPRHPLVLGIETWILARAGRRSEAQDTRRQLEAQAAESEIDPYGLALAYTALGETELAIDALEQAYAVRSANLIHLKIEPFFDDLQSHPRYRRLVERVGLGSADSVAANG